MTGAPSITTAEELLAAGDIGRCELLEGVLIMMTPAGFDHGRIAAKLALLVGRFVSEHKLGVTTAAETGFLISRNPDTVRAPDLGFVRAQRLGHAPQRGYFPGPPDLAVEVLSPDDSGADLHAKVRDWLAAGTPQVWVADPGNRSITIHRRRGAAVAISVFGEAELITAEEPLTGFKLNVADVFS